MDSHILDIVSQILPQVEDAVLSSESLRNVSTLALTKAKQQLEVTTVSRDTTQLPDGLPPSVLFECFANTYDVPEAVKQFLQQQGDAVNMVASFEFPQRKQTIRLGLLDVAIITNNVALLRFLLLCNIKVNVVTSFCLPLELAVVLNRPTMVSSLLQHQADAQRSSTGIHVLLFAQALGFDEITKQLLEQVEKQKLVTPRSQLSVPRSATAPVPVPATSTSTSSASHSTSAAELESQKPSVAIKHQLMTIMETNYQGNFERQASDLVDLVVKTLDVCVFPDELNPTKPEEASSIQLQHETAYLRRKTETLERQLNDLLDAYATKQRSIAQSLVQQSANQLENERCMRDIIAALHQQFKSLCLLPNVLNMDSKRQLVTAKVQQAVCDVAALVKAPINKMQIDLIGQLQQSLVVAAPPTPQAATVDETALVKLRADLQSMAEELDALKRQNQDLKFEAKSKSDQVQQANERVKELKETLEDLRHDNKELREENKRLQEHAVAQTKVELEVLQQQQLQQPAENNSSSDSSIALLREQVEQLLHEKEEMEQRLHASTTRFQEQIEQLHKENEELHERASKRFISVSEDESFVVLPSEEHPVVVNDVFDIVSCVKAEYGKIKNDTSMCDQLLQCCDILYDRMQKEAAHLSVEMKQLVSLSKDAFKLLVNRKVPWHLAGSLNRAAALREGVPPTVLDTLDRQLITHEFWPLTSSNQIDTQHPKLLEIRKQYGTACADAMLQAVRVQIMFHLTCNEHILLPWNEQQFRPLSSSELLKHFIAQPQQ